MTEWNMKASPERYLSTWPNGPKAELAREIVNTDTGGTHQGYVDPGDSPKPVINQPQKVRFFSPKSGGMNIVIEPKEWMVVKTPAGERTIQSPGKNAQFTNNIFITDDSVIIEYLTHTYNDRRFPVVRDDMQTESAHRY